MSTIIPHGDTTPVAVRYTVAVNGNTWHVIDGAGRDAKDRVTGYEIVKNGYVRHFCHNATLADAIAFCNEKAAL